MNPVDQARLDQVLGEPAQGFRVPSAVALLRTPSGTVTAAYGTTELGGDDPVSADDHVRIGSVTKTWTATVVLQQVQEGKLALPDPVSKHRSDVPNGDAITIEQLLTVRSGLYNYTETPEYEPAVLPSGQGLPLFEHQLRAARPDRRTTRGVSTDETSRPGRRRSRAASLDRSIDSREPAAMAAMRPLEEIYPS